MPLTFGSKQIFLRLNTLWRAEHAPSGVWTTPRPNQLADSTPAPASWYDRAVQIAASKYLDGLQYEKSPIRETSIPEMIRRVVSTITADGLERGYFSSEEFSSELFYYLIHQYATFNSPVWFNVGLSQAYQIVSQSSNEAYRLDPTTDQVVAVDPLVYPQISACFIVAIDDSLHSILNASSAAARIFKYGSGFGTDFSALRSSHERLSGGGLASGPISFMKIIDTIGGTLKSGGRTRRAAIMFTLSIDHPDAPHFLSLKETKEKKAQALLSAGFSGGMDGEAYKTVGFQNANISIRLDGRFLSALRNNVPEIVSFVKKWWQETLRAAEMYGLRNAQATVLAPSGTISFMMDCATTGIEPELSLVKYKNLAGGGVLKITNPLVRPALERLGYSSAKIDRIDAYIQENGTADGAPHLQARHLPVFDCSFPSAPSARAPSWQAHLRMMAAAQPFLSGGISKTINEKRANRLCFFDASFPMP